VVPVAELDADPWLLGVENGTLDLRTGTLIPARREDYITKVGPVAFDADAECPVFLTFLGKIMGGDQTLVDYLQRVLGYMLTGDTSEQRLFFLYGTGANGKSTLLNVCKGLLGGDLCRQTPVETIMARGGKK
jgi:putative DNA primase/helicase